MTPIQSDPARRVRRMQKHVQRYQERLSAWEKRNGVPRQRSDGHVDKLYCAEMVFIVESAAASEQTIAEQKARIEELGKQLKDIEIERQDEAYERMERMTFSE